MRTSGHSLYPAGAWCGRGASGGSRCPALAEAGAAGRAQATAQTCWPGRAPCCPPEGLELGPLLDSRSPPPPPRRWSTVGVTRGAQRLLHEAGRGAGPETLSPGELRGGAGTPQVGLGTPHIGVCAGSGKGPTGDRDSWPTLRGGQGPGAEPGAGRWGREMLAVRLVFLCRGRGPDCASS